MQDFFKKIKNIYLSMQDDLSKKTFLARLCFDMDQEVLRKELDLLYDEIGFQEVEGKILPQECRAFEYFRLPECFKQGTAMVDCGCYDGRESVFLHIGAKMHTLGFMLLSQIILTRNDVLMY